MDFGGVLVVFINILLVLVNVKSIFEEWDNWGMMVCEEVLI